MKEYLTYFIFLLAVLYPGKNSFGQNLITLLSSERAINTIQGSEQIRKLYNARLMLNDVEMVCDSAWQFLARNEMRAYGNIQIDTKTEHIWADTLYYYTDREISNLLGRVIITQDSTTLFGHKVNYNFVTKEAEFTNGIRLEDAQGTLIAQTGTYFQEQDSAIFRTNVQVQDSSKYLEGDSLFVNRTSNFYQIYGHVFIYDSTNLALLTGNYLEADSTGRRLMKGNSYLMRVEQDSAHTDTTHMWAGTLLLHEKDSTFTMHGYQQVRLWGDKFSSLSDTLHYNSETELFRLWGNPRAWNKNTQLTGPYIAVQLDSNRVQQLQVYHPAFAVQEDSITARLNQLKGDTLIADFKNGDISTIHLYPNSSVLYHTKNDNNEPEGAIEYSSPSTTLFFEDGNLSFAKIAQNTGLFLPEYEDLPKRTLDGFEWNPDLRPQKPTAIPQPRFAAIPAERPFSLPQRYVEFLEKRFSTPTQ